MRGNQKNPAERETGRLLLEAIITLCLFGLFSVFIFNKQFQQQRQLEEINTAEGIKTIQKAMKRYVEVNWEALLKGGMINGETIPAVPASGDVRTVDISDPELANYLPQGFAADNAFNAGFKIAIKRKPHASGKQPVQVVVVSPNASKGGGKFNNLAGARIAAMVGSGSGYLRSGADGKATGTLGLWSLDVRDYFTDAAVQEPVRVVSTTDFNLDEVENPLWKSALFREKVDGFPSGNAMLTDIDMTGDGTPGSKPGIINLNALRYKDADGTVKDGFLIDAANGEIRLTAMSPGRTAAASATGEGTRVVAGMVAEANYSLKPGGVSLMKDIRLEDMGGARLSDILPKLSLQATYRNLADNSFVPAPGFKVSGTALVENPAARKCPVGYAPAVSVIGKNTTMDTATPCTFAASANASDTCMITLAVTAACSCPSGYTRSGATCTRTTTVAAPVTWKCPNGLVVGSDGCYGYAEITYRHERCGTDLEGRTTCRTDPPVSELTAVRLTYIPEFLTTIMV
jgi:hypothetical protein